MNTPRILFCLSLLWGQGLLFAQNGMLKGRIKDENNRPVADVNIQVMAPGGLQAQSDSAGYYQIEAPLGLQRIRFAHVEFDSTTAELRIREGVITDLPVVMRTRTTSVVLIEGRQRITDFSDREQMEILPIKVEDVARIPMAAPSIERVVAVFAGGSNNEFSSQYRIRGGNFDENLVYVNGIEIYRPFLARAGQQEGLGFTNPMLAQDVYFSTGGFAARYGDKLSSVLDITYRTPNRFRGTAEMGLITNTLHVEGIKKGKSAPNRSPNDTLNRPSTFTYLMGGRRFATTYLLNSLETSGQYRPSFLDYQGMFTYSPRSVARDFQLRKLRSGRTDTLYYAPERLKLTGFITLSRNNFYFEPQARETTFGTIQQAFRLRVAFEGREVTRYTTGLGALMLTHRPHARLRLDYTLTAYRTEEAELFDVEGGYLLGEVNTNFGSPEFNEAEFDLGIGTQYRHARNYLSVNVLSAQARAEWSTSNRQRHKWYAGLQYVYQDVQDRLKEYNALDSAGYWVDALGRFGVSEYIQGNATLQGGTIKGYLQHRLRIGRNATLNTGSRVLYYDITRQWMFSPRIQFSYQASGLPEGQALRLRLAAGVYHQPPFYREFRRLDGSLRLDLLAQRAIHLIAGTDYQFNAWGRPFRFFGELYYKDMANLVPYEIDNVRIRYYPDQIGIGYAYGADARLHGQFIRGVDSWISMNLLSTREDVPGDEKGYLRRPTDQRFALSFYFQDEMPSNPTFKVHVNYIYGSGLRFGPPQNFDSRAAYGFPSYQRVDIGFSKTFAFAPANHGLESLWATLEVFNLFARANTVSYIWIKDLDNRQFAVPNYLSARLINFRLVGTFK